IQAGEVERSARFVRSTLNTEHSTLKSEAIMAREKLGDYRVVREIGRGGMGAVYEGTSPRGERVAIKTILGSADLDSRARWEMVERFMMEARAIRALEHRNIVSVMDVGQDEGEFFMVM